MKVRYLITIIAAVSISASAFATGNGEELFKKHGCNPCHSVDDKLVGPAFKEVAAKYRGNKNAQEILEKKVRSGGSGVWGRMPMPPASKSVSDGDIKTIVQWILSLK